MSNLVPQLFTLYTKLGVGILLGFFLGHYLPKFVPIYLGKYLFWVGVPIGIVAFVRQADLSGSIWIAALAAWMAIFLGVGLAWIWINFNNNTQQQAVWSKPTQGSFLIAAMVGNTGYLGYPITLALVGEKYFAWALFYDLMGTVLGAYGLGVALAAGFGVGKIRPQELFLKIINNPTLWAFGFSLLARNIPLADVTEISLKWFGWSTIVLTLVLMGIRLSQLTSWQNLQQVSVSLAIKMLLVPLFLGLILSRWGLSGPPLLVMVLQMGMPPAFASLVLAETYNLDRNLSVTALAVGTIGLLVTLPLWLWLF